MTTDLVIRPGQPPDLQRLRSWLADSGLPTEDLTRNHMNDFLVALLDQQPVGMIGLESFGRLGLLRSLVVDPSSQCRGIGAHLVHALENRAIELGIKELWLLTIDADAYFLRHGFEVADRADAPDVIRGTPEFSDLCPGDAVLMRKAL